MPNSLMPKYGFIFAQYNETTVSYVFTVCLKNFRELFIKQESLKAISSRVLLLTCSELISKQIYTPNTIYLIFQESYIMVTYGTGYLLSSFTSQCIMDFITSEEATAFSRDYSQLIRKDLRRQPGFDSITFSENSNYWRESLLEVIRKNIAG